MFFPDVSPNYWAYGYIKYLYCRGIVTGYPDGYFRPDKNITRAEFSKMVVSGYGFAITTPSSPSYTDVPTSYWAYSYIETLSGRGVINGFTAAQCATAHAAYPCFLPNAAITRAQIVKMTVLASGTPLYTGAFTDYPDVPPSYWAYAYIKTATHKQWVGGYPDGTFRPGNLATRAELSKILYLALVYPLGRPLVLGKLTVEVEG